MTITKFQIVNCTYWIYGHEPRLMYTDSCNILDSVIYYLQELTRGQYLMCSNSQIFSLGEDQELLIDKAYKSQIKEILTKDNILNTFGYINFTSESIPQNKEYLWWLSENEEYLQIILRDRVISNKTKLKIRDILKDQAKRKQALEQSTEILNK